MKPFMVLFAALCCLAVGLAGAESKDCLCGDANCDGILDNDDGTYILNYLCGAGPAPLTIDLDHADYDGCQHLTIADVWLAWGQDRPPSCPPTHGPVVPSIDTVYTTAYLHYSNRVRAGVSSSTISLIFRSYDIMAFELPVQVRVDGQIPAVDSVVFTLANEHAITRGCHAVYADSGCIALGAWSWGVLQPLDNIATVHLSFPSSPTERPVTVEWANLTPVQAPALDSSVIPMALEIVYISKKLPTYAPRTPIFVPTCCLNAGDVNDDGVVNIGDAVYLITYVFQFGPPPPCMAQADPNDDGALNVGDAVFLINYIFRGGPAPTCR